MIEKDLNRRQFLRRAAIVAGGVVLAGPVSQVLAACGSDDEVAVATADGGHGRAPHWYRQGLGLGR